MTDRAVMVGALALSVALHLGGLLLAVEKRSPAIEGGTQSVEPAQLGNSFQDIAPGSAAARPSAAPDALSPSVPEGLPPAPTATVSPVATAAAAASSPAPSRTLPNQRLETMVSAALPTPETTAVTPRAERVEAAAAEPTAKASPVPPVQTETIAAAVSLPDDAPAMTQSPRPVPRPDRAARTPPAPSDRPATLASSGADRAERRGQDEGRETAAASRSNPEPSAAARAKHGNAKASTYPGLVMRRLSSTPRPRSGGRGAAVVGFEVGFGGELRQAVILSSSGHDEIDRAAIEHVRRAAPFPPPPQGAERHFQVRYESRG